MRASHQPVWWSPFAQWERYKASRAVQAAVRKAIDAEKDSQADLLRWYRQNHVRIVQIAQGKSLLFEVQWRPTPWAPWRAAVQAYSRATANWDADKLAEHLWEVAQPRKVQVVG